MILGVGTDVMKISRLLADNLRDGDPFQQKVFTQREIAQAKQRQEPLRYYATRFAGKEAVFKALQISPDRVRLNEIEILDDENGVPHCQLRGMLAEKSRLFGGGKVHISLSLEEEIVVAFAVMESEGTHHAID